MKAVLKNLDGFSRTMEVGEPPPPELYIPHFQTAALYNGEGAPQTIEDQQRYYLLDYVEPPGSYENKNGPVAHYSERMTVNVDDPDLRKECEDAAFSVLAKNPDLLEKQGRILQLSQAFKPKKGEPPGEYLERLYEMAKTDKLMLESEAEKLHKKFEKMQEELKAQQEAYEEAKAKEEELLKKAVALEKNMGLMPKYIVDAEWCEEATNEPGTMIPATGPFALTTVAGPSGMFTGTSEPQQNFYKPASVGLVKPIVKKEPPPVEEKKGRMIRLKPVCCLKDCNEKAVPKKSFCKKHQSNLDSWKEMG